MATGWQCFNFIELHSVQMKEKLNWITENC